MDRCIIFFVGAAASVASEIFWKGSSRPPVALWGGMGMLLKQALDEISALDGKKTSILALRESFGVQERDEPILKSVGLDRKSILAHL